MHYRRLLRLPQYDYSSVGGYFVTICTRKKFYLFGEILEGEMKLNEMGEIVRSVWEELELHHPNIECDEFVIMPNHIHAIIVIVAARPALPSESVGSLMHGVSPSVAARPALLRATQASQLRGRATQASQLRRGSLGAVVGSYKAACTKRIHERLSFPGNVWQENYYEHVIRDDADLSRIRQYILENPLKWAQDEENVGYVNDG